MILYSNKKKKWVFALAACLLAALLCIQMFDSRLAIRTYTITSDKVRNSVRLVLLTDLHSCDYGQGQQELVNAIAALAPDAILLGGDIADDKIPHDNTKALLEAIGGNYNCYYVSGNHEYMSGEISAIKDMFRSYGVTVLEGDTAYLQVGETTVNLCGVDDFSAGESLFLSQMEQTRLDADRANFTVLLSHRPEKVPLYLPYDYDLVLSGHAHGGQWRIPGLLNGLYAPNQGIFPEYAGGHYQIENMQMIVSRGLARESTRLPRIFNAPELVVVEIIPK